jgi:hypothetical protein
MCPAPPVHRSSEEKMMGKKLAMICAGVVVLLGGALAERRPAETRITIPFDFMVGRHMFPGGEYRVRPAGRKAVRIQAIRGIAAVALPVDVASQHSLSSPKLVFDDQGSPRKLVAIFRTSDIGRQLAAYHSKSLTVITAQKPALLAADRSAGQR